MTNIISKVLATSIQLEKILSADAQTQYGAQTIFLGKVRSINHQKNVVAVAYDAFIPLAEQSFQEIAQEANHKWGGGLTIAIYHRVGKLEVGEVSVAILVSAKHRDESYQASRYIIEQIKVRSPIWKKEYYQDGATEWLKGHALCQPQTIHPSEGLNCCEKSQ